MPSSCATEVSSTLLSNARPVTGSYTEAILWLRMVRRKQGGRYTDDGAGGKSNVCTGIKYFPGKNRSLSLYRSAGLSDSASSDHVAAQGGTWDPASR